MYAVRCVDGTRVSSVAFYVAIIIVIFAYGFYVRKTGAPDVLERRVTKDPAWDNCDGWAMTHLFFWAFLGFWFPDHHLQALGASLGWEAVEDFLGRTHITVGGSRLQTIGHTDDDTCQYTNDAEGKYWYGRYVTDTFFNLAGYIVGSALARVFWPADSCGCARCAAPRKN